MSPSLTAENPIHFRLRWRYVEKQYKRLKTFSYIQSCDIAICRYQVN